MKRETFRHPKLLDLASRLGCSRPEAIGYLQLLWDFTAEYAIQGDIGKHADGAIARACDYSGSPEKFIAALVGSRWLDRDSKHRLLVHHWSDHCERWVKLKIAKIGLSFIEPATERSIEPTIEATTEGDEEGSTGASPSCDQSNPIQSNPIPFDRFWNLYPKKVAKSACEKKWKAKNLDRLADRICEDVEARTKQDKSWLDGFVPNPLTYLNQDRWTDEWVRAEPKAAAPKPRMWN